MYSDLIIVVSLSLIIEQKLFLVPFWLFTDWILSGIRKIYANIIIHRLCIKLLYYHQFLDCIFCFCIILKNRTYYTSSRHPTIIFSVLIYMLLIPLPSEILFKNILNNQLRFQVSTPKWYEIRISSILFTVSKALAISRKMSKAFIP